jgi:hypothetical protein
MRQSLLSDAVEAKLNQWPHLRDQIDIEVPQPVRFDEAAKASLKEAIKKTFEREAGIFHSLAPRVDLMSTFCGNEGTTFKIRWV